MYNVRAPIRIFVWCWVHYVFIPFRLSAYTIRVSTYYRRTSTTKYTPSVDWDDRSTWWWVKWGPLLFSGEILECTSSTINKGVRTTRTIRTSKIVRVRRVVLVQHDCSFYLSADKIHYLFGTLSLTYSEIIFHTVQSQGYPTRRQSLASAGYSNPSSCDGNTKLAHNLIARFGSATSSTSHFGCRRSACHWYYYYCGHGLLHVLLLLLLLRIRLRSTSTRTTSTLVCTTTTTPPWWEARPRRKPWRWRVNTRSSLRRWDAGES